MGLLISASSGKTERAMAVLPLVLIPQILFAGAVAAFDEMVWVSRLISRLTMSRWAFGAAKKITMGLSAPVSEWATLSAMTVMFIFLTFFILRKKGRSWI
jgi:hypothetical protein